MGHGKDDVKGLEADQREGRPDVDRRQDLGHLNREEDPERIRAVNDRRFDGLLGEPSMRR